MRSNYISEVFPKFLVVNNMCRIRFHGLCYYCASNGFHSHSKLGFLRNRNIPFHIKREGIDE